MGPRRLTPLRHAQAQPIDSCAEDFERTLTVNGQAAQTTPVTLPDGAGFADPIGAVCVGNGLTLDPNTGFHTTLTRE